MYVNDYEYFSFTAHERKQCFIFQEKLSQGDCFDEVRVFTDEVWMAKVSRWREEQYLAGKKPRRVTGPLMFTGWGWGEMCKAECSLSDSLRWIFNNRFKVYSWIQQWTTAHPPPPSHSHPLLNFFKINFW